MTTATEVNVTLELEALTAMLEARRDPVYEQGMRRTVPSSQPAHATRVPVVREIARAWVREHRELPVDEVLAVCDALWATGWREERIAAGEIIRHSRPAMAAMGWGRIERWSSDIENWEHVDNLASVTGGLLIADVDLLPRVQLLEGSKNPWQRRFALVTLIVAAQHESTWLYEMTSMAERLRRDSHPLVRRAVVWARATLAKAKAEARRG